MKYFEFCLIFGCIWFCEVQGLERKEILNKLNNLLDDDTLTKLEHLLDENKNDVISNCVDDQQVASACEHWKAGGACESNRDTMREYCKKTCDLCKAPAPPVPDIPSCASTKYGCCWDNNTVAMGPTSDIVKSQCPPCLDKQKKSFCNRWKSDCTSQIIGQGDVMRKVCPVTCGVPCYYNLNKNKCRDDPANVQNCIQWYDEGKCTTEQSKMRVLCSNMCGLCNNALGK